MQNEVSWDFLGKSTEQEIKLKGRNVPLLKIILPGCTPIENAVF